MEAEDYRIAITDAGRTAFEDASPKHHDAVRRYFFDGLSDAERRQLIKVFERLLGRLTESGADDDR